MLAKRAYGPPSDRLSAIGVLEYSARMLWHDGLLTRPAALGAPEQAFTVGQGESVASVATRLQASGLILDADAFRDYLIYTGLDTTLQAREYRLSPSLSIVDVAHAMQDATPQEVTFVILPGWRMEEIAASLPTSGLLITPEAFLAAAQSPPRRFDFLAAAASAEGFLYPDTYLPSRATAADQLVESFLRNMALNLTLDLRAGFARQGLTVYQAVTLASIVQRETMDEQEQPLIASVFLNRLNAGMKLDSDPTVQYALGYDSLGQTWWKNPLSLEDLRVASPFNTYVYTGLPPAPIANPSLSALHAVAFPAETSYYYFRARCDASGLHTFAETFEEHLRNACP